MRWIEAVYGDRDDRPAPPAPDDDAKPTVVEIPLHLKRIPVLYPDDTPAKADDFVRSEQ